jgi:hypothetical protein
MISVLTLSAVDPHMYQQMKMTSLNFLIVIIVVSKVILSLYEMRRIFPNIVCPGCCTFWKFSMFGSIIGCVFDTKSKINDKYATLRTLHVKIT